MEHWICPHLSAAQCSSVAGSVLPIPACPQCRVGANPGAALSCVGPDPHLEQDGARSAHQAGASWARAQKPQICHSKGTCISPRHPARPRSHHGWVRGQGATLRGRRSTGALTTGCSCPGTWPRWDKRDRSERSLGGREVGTRRVNCRLGRDKGATDGRSWLCSAGILREPCAARGGRPGSPPPSHPSPAAHGVKSGTACPRHDRGGTRPRSAAVRTRASHPAAAHRSGGFRLTCSFRERGRDAQAVLPEVGAAVGDGAVAEEVAVADGVEVGHGAAVVAPAAADIPALAVGAAGIEHPVLVQTRRQLPARPRPGGRTQRRQQPEQRPGHERGAGHVPGAAVRDGAVCVGTPSPRRRLVPGSEPPEGLGPRSQVTRKSFAFLISRPTP